MNFCRLKQDYHIGPFVSRKLVAVEFIVPSKYRVVWIADLENHWIVFCKKLVHYGLGMEKDFACSSICWRELVLKKAGITRSDSIIQRLVPIDCLNQFATVGLHPTNHWLVAGHDTTSHCRYCSSVFVSRPWKGSQAFLVATGFFWNWDAHDNNKIDDSKDFIFWHINSLLSATSFGIYTPRVITMRCEEVPEFFIYTLITHGCALKLEDYWKKPKWHDKPLSQHRLRLNRSWVVARSCIS